MIRVRLDAGFLFTYNCPTLFNDLLGKSTVGYRVDTMQSIRKDCNSCAPCFYSGFMCHCVNPISQATNNNYPLAGKLES